MLTSFCFGFTAYKEPTQGVAYGDTGKNKMHYFDSNNMNLMKKYHQAAEAGTTDSSTSQRRGRTARPQPPQVWGRHREPCTAPLSLLTVLICGGVHTCWTVNILFYRVFTGSVNNLLLLSGTISFMLCTANRMEPY